MGFGVDAEVPSWSEFLALRRKLKEIQQILTAGNSELERSLASTDRHLNDVIDSHNELDRTTGRLSKQISGLAESQESLKQYRERIAQNIAREIVPIIEGQIDRFYSAAKEIESCATSTKESMAQLSEDLHRKHQTLADKVEKIQADASRVAGSIDTLKIEGATEQSKFRQSVEDAMLAHSKQQKCIVEAIIEEAKKQMASCVVALDSQRDAIMEKVATCSQRLEDARIETERAQSLLRVLQSEASVSSNK